MHILQNKKCQDNTTASKSIGIIAMTSSESQLDKIPGRELKMVIINIVNDTNKQLNAIRKTIDNMK